MSSNPPSSAVSEESQPLLVGINTPTGEEYIPLAGVEDRKGTWLSTFINLFLTAAGTGILSLPFTFTQTGIVTGNIMLFCMALISGYSMDLLVRCAVATGCKSYENLGRKCYGFAGELAVKISLLTLLFGACVLFLIVFNELMQGFFTIVLKHHPHALNIASNGWILSAIAIVLVFPLTMLKSLHGLRFTSTAGVFCLLYIAVILIVRLAQSPHMDKSVSVVIVPRSDLGDLAVALPIQGIAFCAQFSVMPLFSEIQRPSHRRMNSVIYPFSVACFLLYAVVGVVGYIIFGVNCKSNILENFAGDDELVLVNIGRCLLAATLLLKLPLCSLPFRDTLNDIIFKKTALPTWIIFVENAVLLLASGVLAVLINLKTALGILGGTTGVCISFIFPAALYLRSVKPTILNWIICVSMIVFGLVVGVLGIVTQFVKL